MPLSRITFGDPKKETVALELSDDMVFVEKYKGQAVAVYMPKKHFLEIQGDLTYVSPFPKPTISDENHKQIDEIVSGKFQAMGKKVQTAFSVLDAFPRAKKSVPPSGGTTLEQEDTAIQDSKPAPQRGAKALDFEWFKPSKIPGLSRESRNLVLGTGLTLRKTIITSATTEPEASAETDLSEKPEQKEDEHTHLAEPSGYAAPQTSGGEHRDSA